MCSFHISIFLLWAFYCISCNCLLIPFVTSVSLLFISITISSIHNNNNDDDDDNDSNNNNNNNNNLSLKTQSLGKHVGSFGDGPGEYKRLLDETHSLSSYTAYDGSPYAAENSDNRVSHLDFTIPAFGLPAFDWVLSLEVAEHIPKDYER